MKCPNCEIRDLAFLCRVEVLVDVPGAHDRLWCPSCGHVTHRPVAAKAEVPLEKVVSSPDAVVGDEPVVDVPRGTFKKAVKKAVKKAHKGRKRGSR